MKTFFKLLLGWVQLVHTGWHTKEESKCVKAFYLFLLVFFGWVMVPLVYDWEKAVDEYDWDQFNKK